MSRHCRFSLVQIASLLATGIVLASCTQGGQFDPTVLLNNDMFDTKTKVKGPREAVFPNGVPGATTGIPPDLVKGYQPPPEQADTNPAPDAQPSHTAEAKPAPKPKREPKPKIARAKPPPPARPEISVGLRQSPPAQPGASPWPNPTPANTAQPSQSVWPSPPPADQVRQTAQPSQSIWPNPPATGTTTQ